MSKNEFRYNKKRKHFSYIHKKRGLKVENILISSKPFVIKHKNGKDKIVLINVRLFHHPNPAKEGLFYVVPRNYFDDYSSFGQKQYA